MNLKDNESQDYDVHEAPQSANGGPLLIEASINLSNILEVKIEKVDEDKEILD